MERINERLAIMDDDVKLPQLFNESDDDTPDDNVKIISRCPPELEIEADKWAEKYKVNYDNDDFLEAIKVNMERMQNEQAI